MLTRDPMRLAFSALGFIFTGMVTGNSVLIGLGLIPLIFMYISSNLVAPSVPVMDPSLESHVLFVDDEFILKYMIRVEKGIGWITLGGDIPPHFKLVDGNNIQTLWVNDDNREFLFSYTMKCTKRGIYHLKAPDWEICHPLGLRPTKIGGFPEITELIVKPRHLTAKRVRRQKLLSQIPMPAESRIKMGVPTTSFKELREYSPGDSYRQINWKATARKGGWGRPHVNEYEKEGRRVVFMFLDTASSLGLGTSLKNSFEYAVQATLGLSEYYLSRQCMVGLCFFNSDTVDSDGDSAGRSLFLFPETGKVQQYKIHKLLLSAKVEDSGGSLTEVTQRMRGHIRGTNPLFVVISRVTQKNLPSLVSGVQDFRKYSRRSRNMANVMIINVSGYGLSINKRGDKTAAGILEIQEQFQMQAFRKMGLTAINWNPTESTITDVLLSQVRRR